ncbi:MAG TPA: site-2 protease family protein [Dehalococcoidia bacterium]|nr:site-2 protease family protein [Dehalococcoidia bacterium]
MNRTFRVANILGIPIEINVSWLITLVFVTSALALQFYPETFPKGSRFRDDEVVHWVMAIASGLVFFASILLHELAHSVIARRQGIPVKNITLFIFGGVSQIGGEARRPLYEFVMALVGPLTSLLLGFVFFGAWWLTGHSDTSPAAVVLEWLFFMNFVLAIFNMAPGFPMDGGRVLRSIIWGITGNLYRATRIATLVGRGMGYSLMFIGGAAFFGVLSDWISPWNGAWFAILGMFLESSARQAWLQARAIDILGRYKAEEIMNADLETAEMTDALRYLTSRGGLHFIYFVADPEEQVVGVLTEKEIADAGEGATETKTAADVMRRTDQVPIATPREDGASLLQRMEADSLWHMPVVSDGRVVGVVSKESLLKLLAQGLFPQQQRPGVAT